MNSCERIDFFDSSKKLMITESAHPAGSLMTGPEIEQEYTDSFDSGQTIVERKKK
jgi:hypothetical protein